MLTIAGRARSEFCDGISRRDFLKIGGLALGGYLCRSCSGRGPGGRPAVAQGRHHGLPGGRAAAPGHVRPQAGAADGHPRRVQADPDQCAGPRHLRAHATAGSDDGQVRGDPLAGRRRRDHSAGQCLTGYTDQISKAQGGRPSLGLDRLAGSRVRFTPTSRRSSGSRPGPARCDWGNPGDPGYLGTAHAPFTPFRTEPKPALSRVRRSAAAPPD